MLGNIILQQILNGYHCTSLGNKKDRSKDQKIYQYIFIIVYHNQICVIKSSKKDFEDEPVILACVNIKYIICSEIHSKRIV